MPNRFSARRFILPDRIAKFIPIVPVVALAGEACAPPEWTSPLAKDEDAMVGSMIDQGRREFPFMEALLTRIEPIFPNDTDNEKIIDQLQETRDRIERLYEEGMIVTYAETDQPEREDLFNKDGQELANYRPSGVIVLCRDFKWKWSYPLLVHEGAHAYGRHKKEMRHTIESETELDSVHLENILKTARETHDESYSFEYLQSIPHIFIHSAEDHLQTIIENADRAVKTGPDGIVPYTLQEKKEYIDRYVSFDRLLSDGDPSELFTDIIEQRFPFFGLEALAVIRALDISEELVFELFHDSGIGEQIREDTQERVAAYLATESRELDEKTQERFEGKFDGYMNR